MMVRVAHDHRDGFPSSEFLHGIDVHTGLHQSSRESMAQIVKPKPFHVRFPHGGVKHPQEIPGIHPVPDPVEEDIIRLE